MDEEAMRSAAVVAVGTLIGFHPEQFDLIGHRPKSPIVVCLDSDSISNVLNRVICEVPEAPATVAVYWATTDTLSFLSLEPGLPTTQQADLSTRSTIGELFSCLEATDNHRLTFTTAASSTTITSYESVAA